MSETTLMMTIGSSGGSFGGDYRPLAHLRLEEGSRACFILNALADEQAVSGSILIPQSPRRLFTHLPLLLAAAAWRDAHLVALLGKRRSPSAPYRFDCGRIGDDQLQQWMAALRPSPRPLLRIDVISPILAKDESLHAFVRDWSGPCTWLTPGSHHSA
ncbi:MAG: hypothetical protein EA402_14310 [Planctomycetota bacterium]|nr:MAG: hypothetical protein EA402_14310 [Planctomycetota bacterium]